MRINYIVRHCNWRTLILVLFLLSTTNIYSQLVGGNIYPINGTENPPTSFASITTAVTYLTTNGVTGAGEVILELSPGILLEPGPVTIPSITGTSSTLGVTFRPTTGYIANTTIPGGASPNQHAIRITGSYITLDGRQGGVGTSRDWQIYVTGSGTSGLGQMAVRIDNTPNSITNVTIKNLVMLAEASNTTGAIFQITGNTTNTMTNIIVENNQISSAVTTRGYGITIASASNVGNTGLVIRNNDISNFYARGINFTGGFPGAKIYGNFIHHAVAVTQPTTTEFSAIYFSTTASAGAEIYNNIIYGISLTNGTTAINGIYFFNGNTSGTPVKIYNNFVTIGSQLTSTAATLSVYGIRDNAVSGSLFEIFYNSVYVGGEVVSGANNSAAFRKQVSNFINLRNNIFYNARTNNGGTGTHWGIMINNTTFTGIGTNDYYADGTGGVLGTTDGTTTGNKLTLGSWNATVTSDAGSVSQNPNYQAPTGGGLQIDSTIATQLESGGVQLAGYNNDIFGRPRYPNTGYPVNPSYPATNPDIGAYEFGGIPLDLTPPTITFSPLLNTSSTGARLLSATITDASGVPTTGVGLPVLYWKINSGMWTSATSVHLSGSSYQFTFGSGVALNDTVFYYICAQDSATTPNVTSNPFAGAGGFTINPPAASTPPTTPASYRIVDVPLAGDYTVGLTAFNRATGKNIYFEQSIRKVFKEVVIEEKENSKSLQGGIEEPNNTSFSISGNTQTIEVDEIVWLPMENGKIYEGPMYLKKSEDPDFQYPAGVEGIYSTLTAAVNDLNVRGVSAAVNFLLVDTLYTAETFPVTVNILNESLPTSGNPVTIKPNTSITAKITGASASSQILKILTSYVTVDGSNSGSTSRNLTLENTSTTSPQVVVIGSKGTTPITNVTLKNSVIINGVQTSTAVIVSDGNAPGTAGWFNNINITNNSIQKSYIGNYNIAVLSTGNGSGLNISSNELNTEGANSVRFTGIYVQGVDGAVVSDNLIANFSGTTGEDDRGIWFATGTVNSTIERNKINTLKYTGTGGYGAHGITMSSATANANNTIKNNVIYDLSGDGWNYTSILGDNTHGIYIFSTQTGINVYYNSIHLFGNTLNQSNALSTGICVGTGSVVDIRDNNIVNNLGLLSASGFGSAGIFLQTAASQLSVSNYNNILVSPSGTGAKNVGQIATTGYATLLDWQTATTQDANSLSVDPEFFTTTDLRPLWTSPVIAAGTPIAGITTDFLGVTRSATTPTIGAYEQGVVIPLSGGTYTVGLNAFMQATGKTVTFETKQVTVVKDLSAKDSEIDIVGQNQPDKDSGTPEEVQLKKNVSTETLTMDVVVPMIDGKPLDSGIFRSGDSRGTYPTITSAIADLNLRGVSGPVTFLLVDNDYPSETYPIDIGQIAGADSINTITIKPGTGIQTRIPGSTTQTTATFRLGGADYVTIDGSNTIGGTTKDLMIVGLASGTIPSVHLYSGATYNTFKNIIVKSQNSSTVSGTFLFGSGDPSNNNLIENCTITDIDTISVLPGVGVYFFSTIASSNNSFVNLEVSDFNARGFYMRGGPGSNNKISGCEIFHNRPGTATSMYGISIDRVPGLIIENNFITKLQSSGTNPFIYGIYYLGSSGNPVDVIIRNNVISISEEFQLPTASIRGIDYFGYVANSIQIYYNTVYIGGDNVTTGTSYGITKRDACTNYTSYDNAVYNTRSNSTGTGKHYAVYFSNTTGSILLNNNDYFVDGTGSVLGYYGTADQPTLTAWQIASSQDLNSISANPQFVSSTDFRPESTSPLISAGTPVAGITTDILGVVRNVTTPTIGAYEEGVVIPILAPTNLIAIADTHYVDLFWTDNSDNEAGFVIQRKDGDSLSVNPWVSIDSVGVNVNAYRDSGVVFNSIYTYRVFAYNLATVSGYSNLAQAQTLIPVELTTFVANAGDREISISWTTATEINNRGFDLERKLGDTWQKVTFVEGRGTTTEESNYLYTDKFTYTSFKGIVSYRLKQMDFDGTFTYSAEVKVDVDFTPKEYTLYQNYPNPFNPSTTIKVALPFTSNVRIAVYNLLGEQVEILLDEIKEVGYHDVMFNASSLASGVYLYTIQAKSVDGAKTFNSVKKMMLVK